MSDSIIRHQSANNLWSFVSGIILGIIFIILGMSLSVNPEFIIIFVFFLFYGLTLEIELVVLIGNVILIAGVIIMVLVPIISLFKIKR